MAQGVLGIADLNAGSETLLFQVDVTPQVFNIRFANRNAAPAKVRVAISFDDPPGLDSYVDYDVTVEANGILEDTGLVASNGERVFVTSNVSGVSVRAHGV